MLGQLGTALLLLLGVFGIGVPLGEILRRPLGLSNWTTASAVVLTGIAALGIVTFAVGSVGLLGPWLPFAFAGVGVVFILTRRLLFAQYLSNLARGAVTCFRGSPILTAILAAGSVVAVVASLAAPSRIDEIEYHWPAAVDWAASGMFGPSPYKLVNGYPLMEVIFTAAATQGSYVAAHLLHLITLFALGMAAGGLARTFRLDRPVAAAAGAVVMSVTWTAAYVAYNDTAVGAYTVAAIAIGIGSTTSRRTAAIWVAAGFICIATSMKPTAASGAGLLGLVILCQYIFKTGGGSDQPRRFAQVLREWLILAAPTVAVLAFWSVRQYMMTGYFIEPSTSGLLTDNAGLPPEAAAIVGFPTLQDHLIAPVMPFVFGIIGAGEPWGGRISLALQLFLIPAIAWVLWRRGSVLRRFAVLAVPAWASWIILGLVVVRTRFHIASWVLLVVAARIAIEDAALRYPKLRPYLEFAWTLCIAAGMVDVAVEMVRAIATL